MRFDAIKFLDDHHIPYRQDRRAERVGWLHIDCPLCSGQSRHTGGFNIADSRYKGQYRCWRCGWQQLDKVLAALLRIPTGQAWRMAREYMTGDNGPPSSALTPRSRASSLKWPLGIGPMGDRHKAYLTGRGYDPEELERVWSLMGTDHRDPDFRWRIIAPINDIKGDPISYQGRDIIGDHPLRYRACDEEGEIIHHRHTVYGLDLAVPKGRCLVVEGITDVWRMGPGAVATFGTGWTLEQQRVLVEWFPVVFVFFDPEDVKARKAADLLMLGLRQFGVETEEILCDSAGDPGGLSDSEARAMMMDLGF